MKGLKRLLLVFVALIVALSTFFFIITVYNNIPFLENNPNPTIKIANNHKHPKSLENLKILTYNIHFAIGLNDMRTDRVGEKDFLERLDKIAKVLNYADADIVFLQEVDIDSSRSYRINQGEYIAEKAGYKYFAFATHWKRKVFPDINGRHGFLNHGLCILSRFPLFNHEAQIFELQKNIPFSLRWLLNPHGVQKVNALIGNKIITLVNLHLEPWSSQVREKQMKKVINWVDFFNRPIIVSGDLNVEPTEIPFKSVCHLKDKPWFVSIDQEGLQEEKTLVLLKEKEFRSSIEPKAYLKNPKGHYSYPSYNPQVMLDYIFANQEFEIIKGYIFHEASDASDHLPAVAELKLRS